VAVDNLKGNQKLVIGSFDIKSRLLVGTGKYADFAQTKIAVEASGTEMVTVAIRRVPLNDSRENGALLDYIDPKKYIILPNTAGCYTALEAVKTCKVARELLNGHNLVKLEVISRSRTLYPDVLETLKAAKTLVKEGFEVMVYTTDDPLIAKNLEEIGCVAIMPLGSPIGSGLGLQNRYNIEEILANAHVPVIVDAGLGTASDATIAMELGCDGVLLNTAIAESRNPILMAKAMGMAVKCGRLAFEAGRMPKRRYASASSPNLD